MSEKFNLTWHTFASHGKDLFRNLMETQEYSDVTIVSDDQHQYKAHKFILSECSTVFKNILSSNPLNTSIYLRGIHHKELESILQFIYLGEATFYHERLNEFLIVAKNLDIKDIGKNVVDEEDEASNSNKNLENLEELNENQCNIESNDLVNPVQPRPVFIRKSSNSLLPGDKRYECEQCDYKTNHSSDMHNHIKCKHDGVKYPCQQCGYQATQPSNLMRHIKSIHDGVKYPCQQCDYQAAELSVLSRHIDSKHRGIKYPCQQCDYQATRKNYLQQHIQSKHAGFKSVM